MHQYHDSSNYLKRHGEGNVSLAEYPNASILLSVPTALESPPIESILYPSDLVSLDSYWFAPPLVTAAQVWIGLPQESIILKIILEVDSIGYNKEDMPSINILAGQTITDLKLTSTWSLSSKYSTLAPFDSVEYTLDVPLQCRLISFQMSLQIPEDKQNNKELKMPCLHIGRFKLLGCIVPRIDLTHFNPVSAATASDRAIYDNLHDNTAPKPRVHVRYIYKTVFKGTTDTTLRRDQCGLNIDQEEKFLTCVLNLLVFADLVY
jgi:hypothetical protein